jgi:hypothetical protein
MSFGQGNIVLVINPLPPIPPTPPPVENLINGLYLDGSDGKLGGDLIEQTYVNTADQKYIIGQFNAGNLAQYLDAKNMVFDLGIVKVPHLPGRPGNSLIKLDVVNSEYTFGDRDGWNTGETLRMDSNHIQFYNNYGQTMLIDTGNQLFQWGDIQNDAYIQIYNRSFIFTDQFGASYINVDAASKTVQISNLTKADRNAIANPVGGMMCMVIGEAGGEYLSWYNSVLPGWVKVSSVAD